VPTKLKWLNPDMDQAELLAAAACRLDKIFGCKIATDGTVANDDRFLLVASEGRFKIPADATANKVTAYAVYAKHLADIVARATVHLPIHAIPRDWKALRTALLGDAPMSFERLLNGAWDMGIPVLPLADPIRFHGVCWRINGRNVVVLKQPMSFESRWAFDLVHEIYHAGENPELDSMAAVQCDPMDEARRESDDEANANNMAGNVLLNGLAEELYQKIITAAGNKWQLISVAQQVAKDADVNIGHLANYLAFRLNADSFIEWWGPAAKLQPETDPPFETAKKVFFERVNVASLSQEDRELLEQALSDPELG
jgi:Zn-dependent peptidase ImmA (M78 family)